MRRDTGGILLENTFSFFLPSRFLLPLPLPPLHNAPFVCVTRRRIRLDESCLAPVIASLTY